MSDPGERVLIHHPDGRSYSVTRKAFNALYKDQGFEVGAPESADAFVADVPAQPTRAGARRKSRKPARAAEKPSP